MRRKIIFNYTLFSIYAILLNLFFQEFSFMILIKGNIYVSIIVGTIAGLILKYYLDKKYIFNFNTDRVIKETKIFILYSITGIFTTFIFWTSELIFYYFFHLKYMKYFGAILGLTIGYIVKYHLDKNIVFKRR